MERSGRILGIEGRLAAGIATSTGGMIGVPHLRAHAPGHASRRRTRIWRALAIAGIEAAGDAAPGPPPGPQYDE